MNRFDPQSWGRRLLRLGAPSATLLIGFALFGAAQSETVRYYRAGQVPSPALVASILGTEHSPARTPMKMRGGRTLDDPAALASDEGIVLRDDPLARERALTASARAAVQAWQQRAAGGAAVAAAQSPLAAAPRADALALAIAFDNDSARLSSDATRSLDAVADGMRLAGFERGFVVEGHTSASGSYAHNLRLSRRRADSVLSYLIGRGIPRHALRSVGLGPRVPLNRADPYAAENRRVQFRAG